MQYTNEEMQSILELHRKWLYDENGGKKAYLRGAYLRGADLRGAYLRGAYLRGAYLYGAKNYEQACAMTVICPEGEIIGWKSAKYEDGGAIVKLLIPKSAKRSNATGRKCRASKAKVLRIETIEGERLDCKAWSDYDTTFFYETGKVVEPTEPFDEDRWNECAPGIHFFITREEAVNY